MKTQNSLSLISLFAILLLSMCKGTEEISLPLVAAFSGNPISGEAPLTVNFTDQSTNDPTSHGWDFGDGTTSTQQNPAKTYTTAGNYTVKLTATNSYGSDTHIKSNYVEVTTGGGGTTGQPCPGMPTVTDIDGNVYNTVLIGNQCWMKENLKTTKYRNGTNITYPGTDNSAWENNTAGAYAYYNNDISNKNTYGALYNWYAVNNTNNLCPTGWHVPSDAEWTQLVDYVVAQGYPNNDAAGNALKSCRQVNSPLGGNCNTTAHPRWAAHGTHNGFDAFGFSALPGGYRNYNGNFKYLGDRGRWWSATEGSSAGAWSREMDYKGGDVDVDFSGKSEGFSVRCLRD